MKKTLLTALLCLCLTLLFAAAASADVEINAENFPDENFREIVKKFDDNRDGVLDDLEIGDADEIRCRKESIQSLKGVEYLTALNYLDCSNNKLTELDLSKNGVLDKLYCDENQITDLKIPRSLSMLNCDNNQLQSLDVSEMYMEKLHCAHNQLTDLKLPESLTLLYCDNNQLQSLDIRKLHSLKQLHCAHNQLTELNIEVFYDDPLSLVDFSDNQIGLSEKEAEIMLSELVKLENLTYLDCSNNPIHGSLAMNRNNSITHLNCSGTSIYVELHSNVTLTHLTYENVTHEYIDGWLLPNYCRVTHLSIAHTPIEFLNVEDNPNLVYLNCEDCHLNELILSNDSALTEVNCANNNLLTALHFSNCPALTELNCDYCPIEVLDLSELTALSKASCQGGKLHSLTWPKNGVLAEFNCRGNRYKENDILTLHEIPTTITHLYIDNNLIVSIDLTELTELTCLSCNDCYLWSLDLSNNLALKELYCERCQFSKLDLSHLTELEEVHCGGNYYNIDVYNDQYNLSKLGITDPSRVTLVKGGTLSGSVVTVDPDATEIKYVYDCGQGYSMDFTASIINRKPSHAAPVRLPEDLRRIESEAFKGIAVQRFLLPENIEYIAPDAFEENATLYYPHGSATEAYCLAHADELPACIAYAQ